MCLFQGKSIFPHSRCKASNKKWKKGDILQRTTWLGVAFPVMFNQILPPKYFACKLCINFFNNMVLLSEATVLYFDKNPQILKWHLKFQSSARQRCFSEILSFLWNLNSIPRLKFSRYRWWNPSKMRNNGRFNQLVEMQKSQECLECLVQKIAALMRSEVSEELSHQEGATNESFE